MTLDKNSDFGSYPGDDTSGGDMQLAKWLVGFDRSGSMNPIRITGGTRAPAVASPRVPVDITFADMLHAVRNWMRPRMLSDYGFTNVWYTNRAELGLDWRPAYDIDYGQLAHAITIVTDGQPDDWNGDLVESMRRADQLFRELAGMAMHHSRRAH